jgi:hypothetical protein
MQTPPLANQDEVKNCNSYKPDISSMVHSLNPTLKKFFSSPLTTFFILLPTTTQNNAAVMPLHDIQY